MTDTRGQIADRLAQDARAKEARMLPEEGPLTREQMQFAADEFNEFIREQEMPPGDVARQLGIQIKRSMAFSLGEFNPDDPRDAAIARRLIRWVRQQQDAQREGQGATFVSTRVADKMIGVIMGTHRVRGMGAIVGCSGVSKSTVCRAIEAGIIPGSVHIELTQSHGRPVPLTRLIAKRVMADRRQGNHSELIESVIERLLGTGRLLMIDEAHYLSAPACNVLRDLHKHTGCPIVLVGTQDVLNTINDFSEFTGQFKRLMVYTLNINAELAETGDPLYTPAEVTRFAKSMGLRLTHDGRDYATEIACIPGWGGLGSLRSLLLNARLLAEDRRTGEVRPIDSGVLKRVLREMEGATGFERVRIRSGQQAGKVAVA